MRNHGGALPGNGQPWGSDAQCNLMRLLLSSNAIPVKQGNKGKKKNHVLIYHDVLSAFDIETTSLPDIKQSFMYVWQWCFQSLSTDEMVTVYGRTWEEWTQCANTVCSCLPENHAIVVLDHNLSYEFQFLRGVVSFAPDDVFATDAREIVKCTVYGHLEFRCTMRHSNTSLRVYLDQWHVKHRKMSGDEYNYNIIRYPWTPLKYSELLYALHDVIGLIEAYRAEMEYWNDTLYTVPLTSTGYVRRICKKEWARINYYDRLGWMPSLDLVDLMHQAFRGGDTHASRFHSTPESASFPILSAVESWDRASSYPDVLVNCKYPLGDWYKLQSGKEWVRPDDIDRFIQKYDKAVLTYVHFKDIRLKDSSWEMPYIPKSKLLYFDNIVEDNGRVLEGKYVSLAITDVDWEIIRKEYTWQDCYFSNTYYCRYRRLPDYFLDVVRQFFRDKTFLKGSPEGSLEEIEYNLKKQLLNALYGMAAQWPIKESVLFIEETGQWVDEIDYNIRQEEIKLNRPMLASEKAVFRHNARLEKWESYKKNAFLPYQIGVWCTAWARLELHRSMWAVRAQGGRVLYCDTDSNKFHGKVDMTELNNFYKERSERNGAFADNKNGKRYYMGVYDYEYKAVFATMGAKKYVYRKIGDMNIHLTIAGVSKRKGAAELEKNGRFSAFHAGMVFNDAGGVQGIYNDNEYGDIEIDGRVLHIGPNVCLLPDTYTLGLSGDYARLLDSLAIRNKIDSNTMAGGYEDEAIY